ncbi:YcbK family protein [Rhodospirillum centenum]|uniref:Murein endopeptidase K n=1 Tax=Rhodospirillum centenum (strain ATCC 51521 / SW) TaxID=414684 RepID=B6IVG9_RHOCS|nr:DUF882 domain-containing protein [Rhodospirillum centenum]ACJ00293.1 conserved hypothetical protein [Rhodospirillum centenum SW]
MVPARRLILSACLAAPALALLSGCAARPPEPPPPELPPLPGLRRVVLVHRQSGERADVIYFHNGGYDPRAMESVNLLLRDRNTGEKAPIDPALMDFLFDLFYRTGLPPTTEVQVLSGYRSPQTNAKLVKANSQAARESFHMQGKALDFRVPALPGPALAEIAKTMQRGGAAFYPGTGHIHIDTGPVRTWKTR